MAKLRVIGGPYHGATFELVAERVTVGRDLDNVVRFPESQVSRHHAEIVREGNAYKLRDLNSSNGSFVDGKRVAEFVIQPGNKIRLGDVDLEFEDVALPAPLPKAETPAPPPRVETLAPARAGLLRRVLGRAEEAKPAAAAPVPVKPSVPPPPRRVVQFRIAAPAQRGVWRPPQPQAGQPSAPVTPPAPATSAPALPPKPAAPAPSSAKPPSPSPAPIPAGPAQTDKKMVSPPAATKPFAPAVPAESPKPPDHPFVATPSTAPMSDPKLQVGPSPAAKPAEPKAIPAPVPRPGPAGNAPPRPALKKATVTDRPILVRSKPTPPKPSQPPPARPVIRTVEVPVPEKRPQPAAPAVAGLRQISAPAKLARPPKPVKLDENPRLRRVCFAILVVVSVLVLLAGRALDSNGLRFFGILGVIVGLFCVLQNWSPLPAKPSRPL